MKRVKIRFIKFTLIFLLIGVVFVTDIPLLRVFGNNDATTEQIDPSAGTDARITPDEVEETAAPAPPETPPVPVEAANVPPETPAPNISNNTTAPPKTANPPAGTSRAAPTPTPTPTPTPAAMKAYGQGDFSLQPPAGSSIKNVFEYFVGQAEVDSVYSNVAIATFDKSNQFGAMWAGEKLDLKMSFSTEMYLHLGHSSAPANAKAVADGMTFTMHNYKPALTQMIGGRGEGLGVWTGRSSLGTVDGEALPNALVIEFDTFINKKSATTLVIDPISYSFLKYAHCALIYPRKNSSTNPINVSDHKNTYYFQPSKQWIPFTVKWEPSYNSKGVLGGVLTYSFDNVKQTEKIDNVEKVFGGTEVWWGFTGATGNQTAVQAAAITRLPVPQYKMELVKKVENAAGENIDGSYAWSGDKLTYTIRVTGSIANAGEQIGTVSITDKLPAAVVYAADNILVTMSDGSPPFKVVPAISGNVLTADTGRYLKKDGDWLEISFTVKLKEDTLVSTVVENSAVVKAQNIKKSVESNVTRVTVAASSQKTVAADSKAGRDGSAVAVGDEISYQIDYCNRSGKMAELKITDILPAGMKYKSHTDTKSHTGDGGKYDRNTNTVSWQIKDVKAGQCGSVTVTGQVTATLDYEAVDGKLINQAKLRWSSEPDAPELLAAQNPINGYKVTYVGNGGAAPQQITEYVEGRFPSKSDYLVSGNDKAKFSWSGYTFRGWNTAADGSGKAYRAGDIYYAAAADIILYAQWGRDLVFRKIDLGSVGKKSVTALSGAGFMLYKCGHIHDPACGGAAEQKNCSHAHSQIDKPDTCWTVCREAPAAANDGSIVTFPGLTDGIHLLMEIKAPAGYQLPRGQWIIEVANQKISFTGTSGAADLPAVVAKTDFKGSESNSRVDFWVGNIKQYELPRTGHRGSFRLTMFGGMLLTSGLLLGFRHYRQRLKKRHNNI